MSSAVDGGAWVYYSFVTPDSPWHIFGGTSEASPIFSGIVALANQVAHHRLGLLNPGLYALGALSQHGVKSTGIVDVTSGNNSFNNVTGFDAGLIPRVQLAPDDAGPGVPGPALLCLAYRLIQPVTMGAWSEPSRQRRLIWPDGTSSALNRPSASASTVVTP